MNGPAEDDLPPELLAAYADGELPPDLAARVEEWLASDPDAAMLMADQSALSPLNEELKQELQPPMPSPQEWADCLKGVKHDLRKSRQSRRLRPFLAGVAVAAGLFLTIWGGLRNDLTQLAFVLPIDEDDVEALVLASHEDIEILSIPESAVPLLLAGRHPWEEDIILARAHELEFMGVGSDEHGRFPEVASDPKADHAPLLWTPSPP